MCTIRKHKAFPGLVNQTHEYAPYVGQEIKPQKIYGGFVLLNPIEKREKLLKEGGSFFTANDAEGFFEHFGV